MTAPEEVAEKLRAGLERADAYSEQNLGVLLNLLGWRAPEGSLDGLDGVLIGLRTRDLLAALLDARCRAGLVVLRVEDIHWMDGASERVLAKLIRDTDRPNLLVLHTRRPERSPDWLGSDPVTTLALAPLCADDIVLLTQTHLGVGRASRCADRTGNQSGQVATRFLVRRSSAI